MRAMDNALRQHVRRTTTVLLLLVLFVLVIASSSAYPFVRGLIDRATEIVATRGASAPLLFLVLSALSAMLAFFSTAVVVPIAIGAWGPVTTVILLWAGWWLGAVSSYAIGRFAGRPVVHRLIAEKRLRQFERYAGETLSFPRLLLLQLAIPSEVPGYVLGSLRFAPRIYFAAAAIIELPFAVGAVYLGDRFLQRDYMLVAAVALAGLATTFVAGWIIHSQSPAHRRARWASGRRHLRCRAGGIREKRS